MPTPLPPAEQVASFIEQTLETLVKQGPSAIPGAGGEPPKHVKGLIDDLLARVDTYRDGMLTLLAYPVVARRRVDLAGPKLVGARSVSGRVADILAGLKIAGRKDALQTIAKGAPTYMGRERDSWNQLLTWASHTAQPAEIHTAWLYLASGIAATARDLPPLPPLDTPRLTFGRVVGLLDHLLDQPSGGAHEQFIFAALWEAYLDQLDDPGRVVTKNLNASDASARTAGDVQHMYRGQVTEAYEVTANDWQEKIKQAEETRRKHDLPRVHILGKKVEGVSGDQIVSDLGPDPDISVIEVRQEVHSLVHRLQKPARREALRKLYDHLVERQPRDALVRGYVEALVERGLTEPT